MRAALEICANDLRRRVRDRSALLVAVVIPLALAAVFGLTLGNVTEGDLTFRYAVVDEDYSAASRSFVEETIGGLQLQGLVVLHPAADAREAERLAQDGTIDAAIVLPAGLGAAVGAGQKAEVDVIGSPDAPLGALVARSIAASWARDVTGAEVAVRAAIAAGASAGDAAALAKAAHAIASPIEIEDVSATEKQLDPKTYYAAGMAIFFLFFSVQLGVSSVLDDKRQGTLARMLAAPISARAVLAGKLLTSIAVGVVSMTTLVVATTFALGASWGDPLGVAMLVLAGVLAATAVAALVASFARTPEQAGTWQSIVALVLGMLGGAFFPVDQVGGLVSWLSLATPHAWFSRGLTEMTSGAAVSAAFPATGVLLAIAVVVGAIALARGDRLVAR